jgi:hypothetical protein
MASMLDHGSCINIINLKSMNKLKLIAIVYYPVILAFLSFLYSVTLWFSGYQLEGIFVGIWVPSILAFSIAIRQRRNDLRNYRK